MRYIFNRSYSEDPTLEGGNSTKEFVTLPKGPLSDPTLYTMVSHLHSLAQGFAFNIPLTDTAHWTIYSKHYIGTAPCTFYTRHYKLQI